MKTRLIRKEYDGNNSLFFIKAECITDVWDTEGAPNGGKYKTFIKLNLN
jgi:hypothetical protein